MVNGAPAQSWPIGVMGVKVDSTHPNEVWVLANLSADAAWGAAGVKYFSDGGTSANPADDSARLLNNVHDWPPPGQIGTWLHPGAVLPGLANADLLFHKMSPDVILPDGASISSGWSEQQFCVGWKKWLATRWGVGADQVGCFKTAQRTPRVPSWETGAP